MQTLTNGNVSIQMDIFYWLWFKSKFSHIMFVFCPCNIMLIIVLRNFNMLIHSCWITFLLPHCLVICIFYSITRSHTNLSTGNIAIFRNVKTIIFQRFQIVPFRWSQYSWISSCLNWNKIIVATWIELKWIGTPNLQYQRTICLNWSLKTPLRKYSYLYGIAWYHWNTNRCLFSIMIRLGYTRHVLFTTSFVMSGHTIVMGIF